MVAERFPKKFKSNWAHYFSGLCEPRYTLGSHACNIVLWSYIPIVQAPKRMTNLSILVLFCWLISYLNFCWSASLSLLVLPQFEVLEHLLLVLRYLDIYCQRLYNHVWLSIEQLFLLVEYLALLLESLPSC